MSIERIRNLNHRLLPYSELPSYEETIKSPLVIKRKSYYGQRYLVTFGPHHSSEPTDPHFADIKHEFHSWLKKTEGKNRVLITEGRVANAELYKNEDAAIRSERGELGLLALWAKNHDIEIVSGEPLPRYDEAHEVAHGMDNDMEVRSKGLTGKEVTAYYYFARQIPQWKRMCEQGANKKFENYLQETIEMYKHALQWKDFEFSYKNFLRIHNILYGEQLDPNNIDEKFFLMQTGNINEDKTPIQRITRAVNDVRDKNLANLYAEYWDREVSVFSIFGVYHIHRIAPILNTFGLVDKE
jgi:hypothetical protein